MSYALEAVRRQAARCSAAAMEEGMWRKSGRRPSRSMSVRAGVRYLPTVSTSPDESLSSYTLCMSPFPYVLHRLRNTLQINDHACAPTLAPTPSCILSVLFQCQYESMVLYFYA